MSPRTNSPSLCVPDTQRDTQVSLKKKKKREKRRKRKREKKEEKEKGKKGKYGGWSKSSPHSHLRGVVGLLVDLWGGDDEGDGPGRRSR